jgi:anthranilate synthase/aminodeoxychorismate synthase-like glutamine amidotransferase
MIFLLDNYDSFTYNLVHYFEELGEKVSIERNDKISVAEVIKLKPSKIVISPGPRSPDEAGITINLIKKAAELNIPLLGVCLGHQALAQAFGGKVIRDKTPHHGKVSEITHNKKGLFKGIKNPLKVTRYHSLIVERKTLPNFFEITAEIPDKTIMAIAHKLKPLHGVQFHPESIATEKGHEMLKNFLSL